jgi:hypothetical protein
METKNIMKHNKVVKGSPDSDRMLRTGSFLRRWCITAILVFILIGSMFMSCIKEPDYEGFGDAYFVVENVGQDTLKGLALHAFSYSEFLSVTVTLQGNSEINYELEPYLGYNQDFVWKTPANQLSTSLPSTGDYIFNAIFKGGQTSIFYDKLTSDYILPPVIDVCEFVTSVNRVDVEWQDVTKADVYNVKLLNSNDTVLFVSEVYDNNITNFSFGEATKGWQTSSYPATGQEVKVEVAAYLLEPGKSLDEIQAVSKSRRSIIWGQGS